MAPSRDDLQPSGVRTKIMKLLKEPVNAVTSFLLSFTAISLRSDANGNLTKLNLYLLCYCKVDNSITLCRDHIWSVITHTHTLSHTPASLNSWIFQYFQSKPKSDPLNDWINYRLCHLKPTVLTVCFVSWWSFLCVQYFLYTSTSIQTNSLSLRSLGAPLWSKVIW